MFDRGEAARKLVLTMARFSGLALLANSLTGGSGAILMLHRVTDAPAMPLGLNRHLAITPAFLDAVLGEVKRAGYRLVSMDEAVDRVKARAGGERFASVTLDDAYRDNLTEALPVFEKHEAPFTIYVAPALIDRKVDLWWEVLETIVSRSDRIEMPMPDGAVILDCSTPPRKLAAARRIDNHLTHGMAEEDQAAFIRNMAQNAGVNQEESGQSALMDWRELTGMSVHPLATIGAHTVHHYNLARLPIDAARAELTGAASILEERLGERPCHMAYPYGFAAAVTAREVGLAREAGYTSAVTTRHGVLQPGHADHLHALPRISVNGRYQRVGHVRTMLSGVTTPIANRGRRLVTV